MGYTYKCDMILVEFEKKYYEGKWQNNSLKKVTLPCKNRTDDLEVQI